MHNTRKEVIQKEGSAISPNPKLNTLGTYIHVGLAFSHRSFVILKVLSTDKQTETAYMYIASWIVNMIRRVTCMYMYYMY